MARAKINLSFKQDKINEFLSNVNAKKHYKLFIEDYKEYLQTEKLSFQNLTFLEEEEKLILEDLIKSIGNHDVKTEMGQLDSFIETINIKKQQTEADKNKICPLIIKLSLLFAVGLAIILC